MEGKTVLAHLGPICACYEDWGGDGITPNWPGVVERRGITPK